MQIRFADARPAGDFALVLPAEGSKRPGVQAMGDARASVEAALKRSRFEGDSGAVAEHFLDGDNGRRLLVVGIGSESDAAERLGGAAVARLLTSGESHAVIDLTGLGLDADAAARVALGAALRSWRYDRYRTRLKEKHKPTLAGITIVGGGDGTRQRYEDRYAAVVEGVSLTRELVTEPANIIYPESFVERVTQSVKGTGLELQVLDGEEMAKLGMGALLGVAQGSVRAPRMLVLKWNGGKEGETPVAFIGKGVTFDTGGISIKPAAKMHEMKFDKSGGCVAIEATAAIARLGLPVNVLTVVPATENMPSGHAVKPGDIVTISNGKTVEVNNTDAEGRLVLADVLWYVAKTHKPKFMVDLATLTGAILVALGTEHAGLFSNNDELSERLTLAGRATGEHVWRMPLGPSYDKQIDSRFADMKNTGGRNGGSITAAQLLQRFVDGTPWAHLDIAGTGIGAPATDINTSFGTGYGVRLLNRLVADYYESGK